MIKLQKHKNNIAILQSREQHNKKIYNMKKIISILLNAKEKPENENQNEEEKNVKIKNFEKKNFFWWIKV